MICIAKHETEAQMQRRIDLMLREMVVDEALDAMEEEREVENFTLEQIADFVGVGKDTIDRIQSKAMRNFKLKMLRLEN
jgi:DNA-directed RNA polymerase sigma subunit (sigma70/sigma32)